MYHGQPIAIYNTYIPFHQCSTECMHAQAGNNVNEVTTVEPPLMATALQWSLTLASADSRYICSYFNLSTTVMTTKARTDCQNNLLTMSGQFIRKKNLLQKVTKVDSYPKSLVCFYYVF